MEAESGYMENMQDVSNQTRIRSLASDTKMQKNEEHGKSGLKFLMYDKEAGGKTLVPDMHLAIFFLS